MRNHLVDESDLVGPIGTDARAREHQLGRNAQSDQAGKPLRAAIPRNNAQSDFGLTENRLLARHA